MWQATLHRHHGRGSTDCPDTLPHRSPVGSLGSRHRAHARGGHHTGRIAGALGQTASNGTPPLAEINGGDG
jgi:hypothetical protein